MAHFRGGRKKAWSYQREKIMPGNEHNIDVFCVISICIVWELHVMSNFPSHHLGSSHPPKTKQCRHFEIEYILGKEQMKSKIQHFCGIFFQNVFDFDCPPGAADPVRRSAQPAVRRRSHFPRQPQHRRPLGGGDGLSLRGLAAVGAGAAAPTEAGRGFDCLPRALRDGGPVGCRLQAFLPAWAAITDDNFVLSVIRNGFVIGLTESLPGGALRAPTRSGRLLFRAGFALERASLLKKRAIERVSDQPRLCLSPVFLVSKRSGKSRMILNLRDIIQFIQPVHFRRETLAAILPMLKRVDWAVSIDLSDAYHTSPSPAHLGGF